MRESARYEVRYAWTAKHVLLIFVAIGFVMIALLPIEPWKAVLIGGFGAVCAVGLLAMGLSANGKLALRVDEDGITLGGLHYHHARTTVTVPWRDIEAVVLFDRRIPYIGLLGRNGPLDLPGYGSSPARRRLNAALIPHIPPEVVNASRAINGWKLDRTRLADAIDAHAPEVQLVQV